MCAHEQVYNWNAYSIRGRDPHRDLHEGPPGMGPAQRSTRKTKARFSEGEHGHPHIVASPELELHPHAS